MSPKQKQQIVNTAAQGTGTLASLLHFPDDRFVAELNKLIHTLTLQRTSLTSPVILDPYEDEEL